jgi:membrane protein implicated in regulation of membrane protease activity
MYPFWSNIYDDYKDRRYAALFFASLLTFLVSLGLGAAFAAVATLYFNVVFPIVALIAFISVMSLVWMAWNWVRGWKRHEERLKYPALSRDELAKARSKLKKETKAAAFRTGRRPARLVITRVPETYLKY